MRTKRGQALIELAIGLFALALVTSALCGFAVYVTGSLMLQNELRSGLASGGGRNIKSGSVEVGAFASEYIFGTDMLSYHEKVEFPQTVILK